MGTSYLGRFDDAPHKRREFAVEDAAWKVRCQAINPRQYARTRNFLDGSVTRLSPYLTHGITSLKTVAQTVAQRHALTWEDKWVAELAWRAFFLEVQNEHGAAILKDMRHPVLCGVRYQKDLPPDIREGRTGVRAIDLAIAELYRSGYLHNHARMWLASYVVHVRKVHWRTGADWMWRHLLDGELASNHLSWQWITGTFSSKPYLFNKDNVARFAPDWAQCGTFIDQSYEALGEHAEHGHDPGPEPGAPRTGVAEPELWGQERILAKAEDLGLKVYLNQLPEAPISRLIHPTGLLSGAAADPQTSLAWLHLPSHLTWRWSAQRWIFVLERMAMLAKQLLLTDSTSNDFLCLLAAKLPQGFTLPVCRLPEYERPMASLSQAGIRTHADQDLFPPPGQRCSSFSRYYQSIQRQAPDFSSLVHSS